MTDLIEAIDVSDIPPALLLATLYNWSRPQGMGFLQHDGDLMTEEQAQEILGDNTAPYFDYLKGRVMKVTINGKTLDPWLYDRDLGAGAAEHCVNECRKQLAVAAG